MISRPPSFVPPRSWSIKLTPSQQALADWRRVNLVEEEKALTQSAKSVGTILPEVLKGLGLDRKRGELEIQKAWGHLIDPLIVRHAQPAGLAKGTLFVNVDSNAWLDEIVRYRRREILQRLQHAFGKDVIQRISFRTGG